MTSDVGQIIHWLRIARDYTNELPEFNDPENTVKGIVAHLSAAIAALESDVLAEGYVSQRSMQEYEEMRWTLNVYPRRSKHANIPVTIRKAKP